MLTLETLDFELPPHLSAGEPPEARGLNRDDVRLMVSHIANNQVAHTGFRNISNFLQAGDVLVINTSGTLNAALHARRSDGSKLELHLSTRLPAGLWLVEIRQPDPNNDATKPFFSARAGESLSLSGGAQVTLLKPYGNYSEGRVRLWVADVQIPGNFEHYLTKYGFPIRYNYVKKGWSNKYYQTVYATEAGSAEMPSAGRAFTGELIARLVGKGVMFAPLILHTGVASLEDHEPPYEEFYRVPLETARLINYARQHGKRVIAVGTTSVRALETVIDSEGQVHPGEGWTRLVITPERGIKAVNGMLTGLHEPKATHLAMLEALAGREHLAVAYREALANNYLWHEFGDLHLILP
jgi:S-adenosylmethionine:tRNA ribosyltransferase-isomerase